MRQSLSVHLGVLIGSLRRESFSRKIAKALIERAPPGVDSSIIEIGDLPLYNQDFDEDPPQQWVRFRTALAACDALLCVTPEYNRSMPGCLKNATDIGSRRSFHEGARNRVGRVHQRRPDALLGMVTQHNPATFFPPNGERVAGADEVTKSHAQGAQGFAQGSSGRFEVMAAGASGRLAYWTGIQHADVRLKGKEAPLPMQLRTTEIFRFEQGNWKLAHRHADFSEKKG